MEKEASKTGEICIICDKQKDQGIHLYTSFICADCEHDIIHTPTSEEKYQVFVEKLKRIKTPPLYS
ncbi:sigma factor G inhibitor Gin [Metabacillus arenae]|uniref:Sigma factor G inhibitor Gin n=1 Tax=Metabacillus arenae TaxID=2771434 RepID=A0A926RZ05_9BACI|nr:sigma factor G inhibitor Gin [Metabacillus arenae]MBD1383523.1 sigma factor G inhibitor Gin [Metabacillus arenae]